MLVLSRSFLGGFTLGSKTKETPKLNKILFIESIILSQIDYTRAHVYEK